MKNKKVTFLLIVAVAGVWSVIFYRVFNSTLDTPSPLIAGSNAILPASNFSTVSDTFSLDLNYRDPFLGKPAVAEEATVASGNQVETVAVEVKKEAGPDWSFIQYKGFILNPGSRKKVSIMAVNGKEQMLDEGNEADGVKLIKNHGDSIKVSFQGRTKFILLK